MSNFDWSAERTATEWADAASAFRAQAASNERRKQESWERSDTDGFLSQWAAGQMADRYRSMAAVCDEQGHAEMTTLIGLDGSTPEVFEFEGQWGWVYGVRTADGVQWVGQSRAASAKGQHDHYARKGYTQGTVRARVYFDRSDRLQINWAAPVAVVTADLNVEAVSA